MSADDDLGRSIALQDDGKILVAGYTLTGGSDNDFSLARYNPDGTLDTSFGSGGYVVEDLGSIVDKAYSVAIQDDGKILVGHAGGQVCPPGLLA